MIELTVIEAKQVQIQVLNEFKNYCKKNDLVYFLGYGTLLGAVRHKGYIPWDDDIDIVMPRGDYDEFVQNYNREPKQFEVFDVENEPNYFLPFAKLSDKNTFLKDDFNKLFDKLGVFIDIFPLDGVPDNRNELEQNLQQVALCYKTLYAKARPVIKIANLYKTLRLIIRKSRFYFVDYSKTLKRTIDLVKETGFDDTDKVGCLLGVYGRKEILDKNIFSKSVQLEFEGVLYKAPYDYDKYLTSIYGDYMTLPPEDKRVTHHSFKVYRHG